MNGKLPTLVGGTWLNTDSLTYEDLKNKVVLVDFWTYSCVNCKRTIPFLQDWWKKYKDMDFVMIGIHTPEFDFEKDVENVKKAMDELGVDWPVLLDNDYANWKNFSNHYWPAKYLANKKGKIVYTHFGEGAYKETEAKIQELLGVEGDDKLKLNGAEHSHGNVCFVPTPETYIGFGRGTIVNEGGYEKNKAKNYKEPSVVREDTLALNGPVKASGQFVELMKPGAEIILNLRATEVNIVMHPADGKTEVEILFNGKHPKEFRGSDVSAKGLVQVDEPGMYNILVSPNLMQGELRVRAKTGVVKAYVFTFSGCESSH